VGSGGARSVAGTDETWTLLFTFLEDVGRRGKNKETGVKSCQAAIQRISNSNNSNKKKSERPVIPLAEN